ncbi:MAG: hypothetical protein ACT4PL_06935 [Phycisphaerales bacterium]
MSTKRQPMARGASQAAAALALSALALAGCVSSTNTPVMVDVRDAGTGAPVPGLRVVLSTPEPFHPLRFPDDYLKSNRADRQAMTTGVGGSVVFGVPGPGPVEFIFLCPIPPERAGWGLDSLCFDDLPIAAGPVDWVRLPRGSGKEQPGAIEVRFRAPAE